MPKEDVIFKHNVRNVDTTLKTGKGNPINKNNLGFWGLAPLQDLYGANGLVTHESFTSGALIAQDDIIGGVATAFSNPSAGEFTFAIGVDTFVQNISIFGDNTTLNATMEMVINVDNSANGVDRRFTVQLYDESNGTVVDQQVTATTHNQTVSGNITTITIVGLNGFSGAGFTIELR